MAISSSSNMKPKMSRKQNDGGGGGGDLPKAKRRKCPEVRVVGGRIYDSENGKTCHQCRQKTMDFVAACKNLKNDKLCTFKFCHKCLFNRYGEKAEEMAVVEDWNCPKCRGICNCSFCMKKRGHQPTGILVHTARATGFSSVSELLHVKGSESVGVDKILQGMDTRPPKLTASGTDRAALSPIKLDENSLIEKQKKPKCGMSKENQESKKIKQGKSKMLQDSKNGDVNQEDVALLMEVNDRMTRSGKSKVTQGKVQDKVVSVKEAKLSKPQIAKEGLNDKPHDQETNVTHKQNIHLISNGVSRKEIKACQSVEALKREKKLEKVNPKALPSKKIECKREKQKVTTTHKKHDKDTADIEIVVDFNKQPQNIELQNKETIAEIVMPKGSELNTVAGVGLKPEDVGHALQFLEFCAAFGKVLNLKKGEPEYVLRELITGGRARRGKVSAVNQFHIQLVSLLQEEFGEDSTSVDSSSGRTSWFHDLKDCVSGSQCVLEKLKLEQFGKGSNNYDNFNSSEKLVLLNFICDELLCTEKLRSWIVEQNIKYREKVKEAKERVLDAKQKEKHLKQQMQDDIAKAVIMKNGAPLTISEHDAIVSQIKNEAAQAHGEMLEAKGGVLDEKIRPETVRTQPLVLGADGCTFWRLKGYSNEPDILLQDVSTWDAVGSGEKWFTYTAEQGKEISEYISSLRKRSICKRSFRARGGLKPKVETTAP